MKKFLAVLLVVFMLFSFLVGCANNNENQNNTQNNTQNEENQTEDENKENTSNIDEDEETEVNNTENENTTNQDTESNTSEENEVEEIKLDGTWPEETVKIGFEAYDTTDEQFLAIQKYYDYLSEYFNIEMIYSESIASAEDELKFIENCASAGCKAIIGYYNVSEDQAVQLTIDKGMYYAGVKETFHEKFEDNEYYLGGYAGGNNDYETGYNMAMALIDAGCEKLVYTSGGRDMGVPFFIERSDGFYDAIEEAQKDNPEIEVVYDVSGWPGTDSFTADQTKVCDMDVDGIGNSFSALVWIQPLSSVGKFGQVKLATIGSVNDVYKDLMAQGAVLALMYECEEVQFGNSIPLILNAVSGNLDVVRTNESKAAHFVVPRWNITDPDVAAAIYEKHEKGEYYVTAQEVASTIKAFNPSATYETLTELYKSKSVDIVDAD